MTRSRDPGYGLQMTITRMLLLAVTLLTVGGPGVVRADAPSACQRAAAVGVTTCTATVASLARRCYLDTGAPCPVGDTKVTAALAKLEKGVLGRCPDASTVQAAGYGALLTPAALVDRLRETCLGEPATLAARTFGGPQGALLAGAAPDTRSCLGAAYDEVAKLLALSARKQDSCIRQFHRGKACDTARLAARLGDAETRAQDKITAACTALEEVIGLRPDVYVARGSAQARCMTATGHGDTTPLTLDCGPRPSVPVPPRGTWVQVVLDEATWGTRCGDGSPYAFWLRLAPSGAPLERVITDMAGGGVCIFDTDCASVSPSLLKATDDGQPSGGYLSTNPAINPFSDWTMLYMPYCTQDVHIGGGLASVFSPTLTVYRFGAINARAALRYLRDVLWAALDDSDPQGWRPDRLRVLFGGESAGGFGVEYNYHYPLDELRWIHTTALPDSGLALDNGGAGVRALGTLITTEANPFGWGTRAFQPPYCLAPDCAVGPVLLAASSARLKRAPEQEILSLSNQNDGTQVSTTLFAGLVPWLNTLRTTYCANRGKTGLHWFLPAVNQNLHTMLRTDSRYTGLIADGVSVRDYLAAAVADPDTVVDRVDEGTFVTDVPGVHPFTCLAGSPSGAFVR
ncbi:MAG TPA: pectin acetylesterase-family hydrolase [Candidatus Binatia bacterium]|nr:pectin acetylesterase-family hydrolase [Candidatus Binatia bacterium]